jgi:hypothetical protein
LQEVVARIAPLYREFLAGYSTPEHSWVLTRKSGEVRRRFDHIFASAGLRPTMCHYLHEAREAGLSDHSPMIAEFELHAPLVHRGRGSNLAQPGWCRGGTPSSERTIGIDLSAQPERTAGAVIEWFPDGGGRILDEGFGHPLGDGDVVSLAASSPTAPVGIDAPFGWPIAFRRAITKWEESGEWSDEHASKAFRFRETDLFVRERVGWYPLSVSTDLIGVAAFRCARLLAQLAGPEGVERVGGRLIEVYPAAALYQWDEELPHKGYKGPTREAQCKRKVILEALRQRTGLELSDDAWKICLRVDHCLDALICAVIARTAALGRTLRRAGSAAVLEREGWIELPEPGSLDALAAVPPPAGEVSGGGGFVA